MKAQVQNIFNINPYYKGNGYDKFLEIGPYKIDKENGKY